MKCTKCNKDMKKSGPYAPIKKEGQPSYKGSLPVYYCCMNEKCSEFGKNITVQED